MIKKTLQSLSIKLSSTPKHKKILVSTLFQVGLKYKDFFGKKCLSQGNATTLFQKDLFEKNLLTLFQVGLKYKNVLSRVALKY